MTGITDLIYNISALIFLGSIAMIFFTWAPPHLGLFWTKDRTSKTTGYIIYSVILIVALFTMIVTVPPTESKPVSHEADFPSFVLYSYLDMLNREEGVTSYELSDHSKYRYNKEYYDNNYRLHTAVIIDVDKMKILPWNTIPLAENPSQVNSIVYLHYNCYKYGTYTGGGAAWHDYCNVMVINNSTGKEIAHKTIYGPTPPNATRSSGDVHGGMPSDSDIQRYLRTLQ